jgi:hypothetical protein
MHSFKSKKFLQYCTVVTLSLCLTGCMGVYEGGFECPPGEGVGCKSISEVNQMVDQGELPPSETNKPNSQTQEGYSCGAPHMDAPSLPHEVPKIWYSPWGLEEA